jgi:hypothetical protein
MQTLDRDSVSTYMEASPDVVYDLVADVTRMAEFSPEILRCTWLDGATGPAVGARFAAVNHVRHRPAWTNKPVVTVARPGRVFAFARTEKFAGTVEWTYRFQPEGTGTRVTESYEVTRPVTAIGWFVIGQLFGARTGAPTCAPGWSKRSSACAQRPKASRRDAGHLCRLDQCLGAEGDRRSAPAPLRARLHRGRRRPSRRGAATAGGISRRS